MFRDAYKTKPFIAILAGLMLMVALACGGDAATPTTEPTSPAPVATAATAATAVPAAPTGTAPAGSTATAVPLPTGTAVPVNVIDLPFAEGLVTLPGYRPEWGVPQKGGTLRLGAPRTPPRFHTAGSPGGTQFSGRATNAGLLMFNPWVGVGPENILTDTAKAWEFSGDGLSLTFYLKEGVKFANNPVVPAEFNGGKIGGDELTCEDVRASLERSARPPAWETRTTAGKGAFGHINSVSCPDGDKGLTAVFNLDYARASTLAQVANRRYLVMLDKDWIDWYWEGDELRGGKGLDVGTPEAFMLQTGYGAWIPEDYTVDVIAKYLPNPDYYWEGAPMTDALRYHILKDGTTRFASLVTGKINYFGHSTYSLVPGQVAQAIRDFPEIQITSGLGNWSQGVNFNTTKPPFDDVRVRQAFQLGIAREDWIAFNESGPYPGAGLILGLQPLYYTHTYEELIDMPGLRPKDTPGGIADVKKANELLDEVYGKGNRPDIEFFASNTQSVQDMGLFVVDQVLRHLGITMTTQFVDSTATSDYTGVGNYMMSGGSSASTDTGDPDDYVWTAFHRDYVSRVGWNGERTDAVGRAFPVKYDHLEWLIEEQARELDLVKRRALVMELDELQSYELVLQVPVGSSYLFQGVSENIRGYVLVDFGTNIWSFVERMWFAEE